MENKIIKKTKNFLKNNPIVEIGKISFYVTSENTFSSVDVDLFRIDKEFKYIFSSKGTWSEIEDKFFKFLFTVEENIRKERENNGK